MQRWSDDLKFTGSFKFDIKWYKTESDRKKNERRLYPKMDSLLVFNYL